MNPTDNDERLRTAVHEAVAPVTSGMDMMERVRAGVARRRRRRRVAGSATAVVALAAGFGLTPVLRHGSTTDSTAGVAAPDCSAATAYHDLPLHGTPPSTDYLVPPTPIEAVACNVTDYTQAEMTERQKEGLALATGQVDSEQRLTGERLRAVAAAVNSATPGAGLTDPGPKWATDRLVIVFRYRSRPDVVVTTQLSYGPTWTISNDSYVMGHFSPRPIPDVIMDLARR